MPADVVLGHWDVYELLHRARTVEDRPLATAILPGLRQGGVRTVLFAVGGDSQSHASGSDHPQRGTLVSMDVAQRALDDTPGVHLVTDRATLRADDRDSIGFLYVLEGGRPLEGSIEALRQFYRLGVRCMLLTWNGRNELGDGVGEGPTAGGLSRFGREVVHEMRRLGMLLDLSHLSERGFYDAIAAYDGVVTATHSNAKALHDHPRNLTDDQIEAVAATGGVIGIAFMPAFLSDGQPTVDTVVDHIDHVASLVGAQHVAIGPDFSYGPVAAKHKEQRRYEGIKVDLDVRYPIADATELPALVDAMQRRGVSDADIRAIMGANLHRILAAVLPERTLPA